MTLYAVGDLQGCLEPLERLMAFVDFNPKKDTLWFTGDLVNRGPDSIGCLSFVRDLGDAAQTVLGNHDLHLLAAHELQLDPKDDDIKRTLNHPKADKLLDWLAQQPLLVRDKERRLIMTHAGIPPVWMDKQARQLAREVEAVLADPKTRYRFFEAMYGNKPHTWVDDLTGDDRLRYIVNAYTRMRFCNAEGTLEFKTKTGPDEAPMDMKPWFTWPVKRKHRLVFGHWASLMGETHSDDFLGLDTGYVWGGFMTLMDLDKGIRYGCDTRGEIFNY